MTPVPRVGRVLDAMGAFGFLAGAALVARAWVGFRAVQSFERGPDDGPRAAVELADHFWRMQKIGVVVMVAGVGVFVAAWWIARTQAAR